MDNIDNLRGHPFAKTYKALMALMVRNSEKVESKKHGQKAPQAPPRKRQSKAAIPPGIPDSSTVRPHSSDSGSTALSGATAESKDEEFSKGLLNDFVDDVLDVLGAQGTKLTWP